MTATLCLGPLLFNWPAEQRRDFYFRIADEAPVDVVYFGEVVCGKRTPLFDAYFKSVVERLRAAGKEVILSTLALVITERDLDLVREVTAAASTGLIEANDVSAVGLLAGRPHVIGPYVCVYNEETLHQLVLRGAECVCLSGELPRHDLAVLAASTPIDLEVQVFGRLPLALSARCYHARARGISKDNCQFVCGDDWDGLPVETVDGAPFVSINGVQVLSHTYVALLDEIESLKDAGITRFRLSPHHIDMVAVAQIFRGAADGVEDPKRAMDELRRVSGGATMANGYFHDAAGMAWHEAGGANPK
ncbi:MAG: U32 family peptidase [Proteobacteria bacterium]|nr:U32 family peptidase [Pseudomonadota bacterium]